MASKYDTTLARLNAPPIAAGWNELGRGIRNDTSLPTDLKEALVRLPMTSVQISAGLTCYQILRVVALNEAAFVWWVFQ